MNEDDWNSCTDPQKMLKWLRQSRKATERKLRLFACALCRRVWAGIPIAACRRAAETAEACADDLLPRSRMLAAGKVASASWRRRVDESIWRDTPVWVGRYAALGSAHLAAIHATFRVVLPGAHSVPAEQVAVTLREILGFLLFRPVITSPFLAWNDGIVRQLAQAAYDERLLPSGHLDPARLAILADALEEASCSDASLLAHLRSPGPHVRGCFALDAVLGKG